MVRLAVINLKTLLKSLMKVIVIVLVLAMVVKFSKLIYQGAKNFDLGSMSLKNSLEMMKDNVRISACFEKEQKEKRNDLKKILVAELAVFSGAEEEIMEKENQEEVLEFENGENRVEENQEIKDEPAVQVPETQENQIPQSNENSTQTNAPVTTTVIQANNKKDIFTDTYQTVQIKNESKYALTEAMVTPDVSYQDKKDILIYHTHTCESYTQTENERYLSTGNFRTTDLNHSVARVGTELANCLAGKGYTAIHDTTYHDYPAYTGSYTRSLSTVKNLLNTYQSVDCVFDVHRDALGSNSNYAPCVQIGEEQVAQLMFVIGTDGGGLDHPNWNANLKLAVKVQQKANEMYPGLFKPIILRNSRYNQHVTKGAAIIEVGATGNTLEQCTGSMKYLAEVMDAVMKEN